MKNSREVAFDILKKVLVEGAYSNLAIDSAIKENNLSKLDSSFCTALVYGVLERLITLDYIIRKRSSTPFRKIEASTLIILRMGFYQLLYMDKVPDSAAVNESVNLAKKKKLFKSSGFINGILRTFLRENKEYKLPAESEKCLFLSVKYSCPEYLVKLWLSSYGEEITLSILESLGGRPPLTIHTNTMLTDDETLITNLKEEGVEAELSPLCKDMLLVKNSGALDTLKAYELGEFFVQDTASAICAKVSGAKSGDTVFDVCSAPGGKAFAMAINMENKGEIRAFDLHPHKIKLIENGAKRLGISIIKAALRDGAEDNTLTEKADVVLCDVPCSGFGIIRRKPEIRYSKSEDYMNLPDVQLKILENSAKLVKDKGTLVYSTCTLNPQENSDVVNVFLKKHPEFTLKDFSELVSIDSKISEPSGMLTLFPSKDGSDGFFIAKLERSGV
ncbi:MAG: 16S rRNA (cytosine(967)-C(5))-methyltransferase RsmB [Ruminococcaceae bacterium]|nr:16S rRNA (cytosine(967)-C(5))-methyltransferase RsmB [Oscillospiraceae bacterium]